VGWGRGGPGHGDIGLGALRPLVVHHRRRLRDEGRGKSSVTAGRKSPGAVRRGRLEKILIRNTKACAQFLVLDSHHTGKKETDRTRPGVRGIPIVERGHWEGKRHQVAELAAALDGEAGLRDDEADGCLGNQRPPEGVPRVGNGRPRPRPEPYPPASEGGGQGRGGVEIRPAARRPKATSNIISKNLGNQNTGRRLRCAPASFSSLGARWSRVRRGLGPVDEGGQRGLRGPNGPHAVVQPPGPQPRLHDGWAVAARGPGGWVGSRDRKSGEGICRAVDVLR